MKMRDNPKYENFRVKCLICNDNKEWKYLGSHITHKHKISVNRYKSMYGLPHKLSLMDDATLIKKQKAFEEKRDKYLKNLSKTSQFKKGFNRYSNAMYLSELEKNESINNIHNKQVSGKCPVCNMLFDHLPSHLFNKHELISKKKESQKCLKKR